MKHKDPGHMEEKDRHSGEMLLGKGLYFAINSSRKGGGKK